MEIEISKGKLLDLLSSNKRELDKIVLDFLPKESPSPEISKLYEMMRDYPSRGGKGFRGSLCLLFSELFGGKREAALITAAGLELFQNWILIHDDIEDESELRRGYPALHRKYGVPLAINTGDALHGKMWELLVSRNDSAGTLVNEILKEFSTMINETTEGQQMELSWIANGSWTISETDYLLMVTKKSAWYTCTSPCRMGAILAFGTKELYLRENKPKILEGLVRMGTHMGIAFQIIDDILNLTASEKNYGKEIMGDIFEGKRTLMLIHLISSCSYDEREKVLSILSRSRKEKTDEDVELIFDWMNKTNSIKYAQEVAERHAAAGLALFDSICNQEGQASPEILGMTKSLLQYLVKRDH